MAQCACARCFDLEDGEIPPCEDAGFSRSCECCPPGFRACLGGRIRALGLKLRVGVDRCSPCTKAAPLAPPANKRRRDESGEAHPDIIESHREARRNRASALDDWLLHQMRERKLARHL